MERLLALAALEGPVAGEAVAVALEVVGHLLLPGIDEPDLLVIGHAAHFDEQTDVVSRVVVDLEEVEYPALVRAGHAVPRLHHFNLPRRQERSRMTAGGVRRGSSRTGPVPGQAPRLSPSAGASRGRP